MRRLKDKLVAVYARLAPRRLSQVLLECAAAGLGAGASVPLAREIQAVLPVLKRTTAPVVLDVGANAGDYASAIRLACPGARVFAFEPGARVFATTQEAARSHGFTAINKGMGAKVEERILYDRTDAEHGVHASLYEAVITDHHRQSVRGTPVQITTVDAFVAEQAIVRIALLKIDTEGAEMDVLNGARGCLDRGVIDAIQFEFNEMNTISRVFMRDFMRTLSEFDFYRISDRSLVPLTPDMSSLLTELFAYQNVVAFRRGARS